MIQEHRFPEVGRIRVTEEAAKPPGLIPRGSHYYTKEEMLGLEPHERSTGTPYGLQWWVTLLIFGRSMPIPDDHVAHTKWKWYTKYNRAERRSLIREAKDELAGLRASTGDILSRIAVVAVLAALGIQPVQSLLTGKQRAGRVTFAWITLALIGVAILCLLTIVTPKLKVWVKQKQFAGKLPAMLTLMDNHDVQGWPGYLRLTRKIEHRRQLIRFERRLQVVAAIAVVLSMVTLAFSLALH